MQLIDHPKRTIWTLCDQHYTVSAILDGINEVNHASLLCIIDEAMKRVHHQGWHIGIGRYEISADIAHIGKTDISVSVIIPADNAWILIKARISADSIGRYIGYDNSILAYRLSVKFHRYANPAHHVYIGSLCSYFFVNYVFNKVL